jgi:signal transduction histidine kinase
MNRDERLILLVFGMILTAFLVASGLALHGYVSRTLAADTTAKTAILDLFLRDRSRYLAETLQPEREKGRWPENLPDILTRNHADYNRDIFMQVFETDGRLVAASDNTPLEMGLSAKARREGAKVLRWLSEESSDTQGRRVRLVTFPIYTGDPNDPAAIVFGFAQAGLRLPDAERAVARFTWVMAAGLAGFGVLLILALRTAIFIASDRLRRESLTVHAAQHRFVGDAAHELGTPLAILQGEIDIALRRERSAAEYRAALVSCREEIERLSRLSENLLVLASADASQQLLHPSPCDAATVVRIVHGRFARLAEEKNVEFKIIAPDTLPWYGDALALEQILGNLVANAIRHTPRGESVSIEAEPGANEVVFHVRDTGEGILPAHLPLLFDRFYRVDKARSRAAGGAGLGLAIVKTLVASHGGTVTVVSTLGHGSTFTCRFFAGKQT